VFSLGFHFWLAGSAVLGALGFLTAVAVHTCAAARSALQPKILQYSPVDPVGGSVDLPANDALP
jgi:hypothetical protein